MRLVRALADVQRLSVEVDLNRYRRPPCIGDERGVAAAGQRSGSQSVIRNIACPVRIDGKVLASDAALVVRRGDARGDALAIGAAAHVGGATLDDLARRAVEHLMKIRRTLRARRCERPIRDRAVGGKTAYRAVLGSGPREAQVGIRPSVDRCAIRRAVGRNNAVGAVRAGTRPRG